MDMSVEEKLVILLGKCGNSEFQNVPHFPYLQSRTDNATNPNNSELDVAKIDAFCCAVKNDSAIAAVHATKLLGDRIQSDNPCESLNALNVSFPILLRPLSQFNVTNALYPFQLLDECMSRCGAQFQSVVGRFRFLNELVKLVSPKYLAGQTNPQVKGKILDLLLLWTVQYPNETKVKEAYEMLLRQGVIHEDPNKVSIQRRIAVPHPPPQPNSADADPTSLKIKQLIQSKKPDRVDIHAANLLIQNFYEVEKKKTLRVQEIKKGRLNVTVLDEMLENVLITGQRTDQDDVLMKELYENCKQIQPTILLLTEEPNQVEQVMQEALETNDALVQVVQKFESIVIANRRQNMDDDVLIDMQMEGTTREDVIEPEEEVVVGVREDLDALDIFGFGSSSNDSNVLVPENSSGSLPPPAPAKSSNATAESSSSLQPDIDSIISAMMFQATATHTIPATTTTTTPPTLHSLEDINVDLDSVELRSDVPPRTVLNEAQGLRVVLNFTKEHPREDVAVIVASVANHSAYLVTDIEVTLQHAHCLVRRVNMEPEESLSLAGVKRFSSAFNDLTLVFLVSNAASPSNSSTGVWNIDIKYKLDGHQHQEMVNVSDLPDLF